MRGTMRIKFKCPACKEDIKAPVIDTYPMYYGFMRYRKCEKCNTVFVTTETVNRITHRKGREVNGC